MPLVVYTARAGAYRGPDGMVITRQFARPEGLPFAPSWPLLGEAKRRQRNARATFTGDDLERADAEIWGWYEPLFIAEMRGSYRTNRPAWDVLLARGVVTLLCVCAHPTRCHRHVLRTKILPALGAVDGGER